MAGDGGKSVVPQNTPKRWDGRRVGKGGTAVAREQCRNLGEGKSRTNFLPPTQKSK